MVFEKNDEEKSIILEDETGQTKVYFEDDEQFEEIILDDVVGVVCEKRGEKDFVKEIVWPYVASKREVVKDKGKCIFISDFSLDKKSSEIIYKKFLDWIYKNKQEKFYIFVLGNISKDEKKLKDFFDSIPNNFFKIFISSKTDAKADVDIYASRIASITIGKVSFLLSSGDTLTPYVKLWKNSTPEKIMLKILKRRYINVDGESFIIKNFPDIFAAGNFGNVGMMNYKGTTILSTGDSLLQPIYWLIDLASRETLKIDFS